MKTAEFNKSFEIDRKAKGIKALPKGAAPGFPEAMTADGKSYSQAENYFFFDESAKEIRQIARTGLRQIDAAWLGSMGYKIVKIANLRADRNDALADGQDYFLKQIEDLREAVRRFEAEKTPEARSLKAVLMSK